MTPGIIRARRVEAHFARRLRKIASIVAEIVRAFPEGDLTAWPDLEAALARYSEAIEPWARAVCRTMHAEVDRRDLAAWAEMASTMKRALKQEIATAPTGTAMRKLLADQVTLIKSLPIEAGERVHQWTLEGIANGTRAAEVSKAIQRTGEVTAARATLIARTEVSRTAATLTQARGEHIGSPGYNWTTSRDGDVRASHKAMDRKFVRWSEPPTLDKMTGHAGCLPNCRCFMDVVVPE